MKRRFVLVAALSTTAFSWFERLVAPSSELVDPHWQLDNPGSTQTIDHAAWTRFLEGYLQTPDRSVNRLSYSTVTPEDRAELDTYLEGLQLVRVTELGRAEQLPYWINFYNAKTVAVVLDHYPVESIRDIKFGKTFAIGPWGEPVVTVEGRELSLNDIEHGIVRPIFQDPRLHYAFNCAAVGCPNLQAIAFTAERIDNMLDAGARAYVNDPRGVDLASDGKLTLSSIYNWFAIDFGAFEPQILDHVRNYAEPDLAARLMNINAVDDYVYDWSLNDGMPAS